MKREKMTFEDHAKLGDELKRVNDDLLRVAARVQLAYGKTSPDYLAIIAAIRKLTTARCNLDDRVCSENPRDPDCVRCYYGTDRPGVLR